MTETETTSLTQVLSLWQHLVMQSLQHTDCASSILAPPATLSMEVSFTFHSHLIGRSGQNVNRVMDETGTRIHFPDRNRIVGEYKCNNVIIRGSMANIELARTRIRMDIPVEIIIDCSTERISSIGQSSLANFFSKTYGVLLRFYPKIDGINCQVNVRGQQNRIQQLKEAVIFFGRMTQTRLESMGMKIDTSFDHVWLIHDKIDKIASETGTGIRIPDVSNLKELPKKYCIWIRGPSVDAVYVASTLIHGLLPMQLMVQIPSDQMNHGLMTEAQEMDVLFHVERFALESLLTIRLTSYESNGLHLFEMLRRCLGLPLNQAVVPNQPSLWSKLDDLITGNSFLPSSKKLYDELSFPKMQSISLPLQSNGITIEIPIESPADCSVSSVNVYSPCASNESCIPASLTAARFDPNSSRHLADFLETVGLSHYSHLFFQNEIDMAMFTTLKEEDLMSIGITSFGARKIMLNSIKELRM